MVSAAEREKARRLEVERAFVKPGPVHDWADAAPTDRPSKTVDSIVAAARGLGWVVEEKTRYDWHQPTWVTDPDGGPARYIAKHRVQYHLFAHAIPQSTHARGQLAAVNVLFVDGAKWWIKLGRVGQGTYEVPALAISSVAKLIREEGIKA